MTDDGLEVALGVLRVAEYAGFVLIAGTLAFWVLVWPVGTTHRRLTRLASAGLLLLAVTTATMPLTRWLASSDALTDVVSREEGSTTLAQLALLALIAGGLGDLVREPLTGVRRVAATAAAVALSVTLSAQVSAVSETATFMTATMLVGHLLAMAVWLGGLVALLTVISSREHPDQLDDLIPRFTMIAFVSMTVLVVTGAGHALAVSGGLSDLVDSRYGLTLLVKVALFVVMVGLAGYVRRYSLDVQFRREVSPAPVVKTSALRTVGVVLGAQLVAALSILLVTAVLVGLPLG